MRLVVPILVVALSILPCYAASKSDDVKVKVSLSKTTVAIDDPVQLEVRVEGASQDLPDPKLPTLPTFEVYSQGRSSSYNWTNGVVSSSVISRYLLIPQKVGTYPIDQISVVVGNKRYKGNPVEITVIAKGKTSPQTTSQKGVDQSGKTRDYFLEAEVDNSSPYVNQQVLLTLRYYIAVQQYGTPQLIAPSTVGFWTEELGNKTPYYQRINGRRYKVIEIGYALFPTQTGNLTIGRATIQAQVASRNRNRSNDPFGVFGDFFGRGKDVTMHSSPLSIEVKPLPRKGRPDSFTGTIGDFRIWAVSDKKQVEVNQPVTVTISISGSGNVKSVAEPVIPESDDFRVYRSSSSEDINHANNRVSGTKVFEEVFIPRRPGNLEIPALQFAYFDPEAGRYRTAQTEPIKLLVTRPEGYAEGDDIYAGEPGVTIGSETKGIRHIKSDLGRTADSQKLILFDPVYMAVNGLPVLALLGAIVVRRRRNRLSADVGYARSRAAGKEARRRLAEAQKLASSDQSKDFYAEIYNAVTSYVADKLNISPHGLTSEKISQLLGERQADEELVAQVVALMRDCDFARYGAAGGATNQIESTLRRAEEVMTRIEEVRFD